MKMRFNRRMRTKPREYTLAASIKVPPYTAFFDGMEIPMDTRRVSFRFFMQDATHKDCMRKIKEVAGAMNRSQS